jgi:UDP-hydrolysing UDP-N-acetyl-D-glucosamine 2-epimerase
MKICIATGTRAEYGLLKPLMEQINQVSDWTLQVLVTGAHLSPEFGLTYRQIENDGFIIDAKVEMLLSSDTDEGIVKSMGLGMVGFADAFKILRPDLLIILGDRYEMLAVASSALIFKIPIAHIHGGEITEGAYDDAIRHSITKMSHLHFASTEVYKNRIVQLGERPEYVFNIGAIALDNIRNTHLLSKEELEMHLGIRFKKYNYQVTFHPTTLDIMPSKDQFQILLDAIDVQEDSFFIFTGANADTDGRIINQMIDRYVSENPEKASVFPSLGSLCFLSVVKICDAIVGNSSSGIIEAPSLNTTTINIGIRQKGRIQADSIINTNVDTSEILQAFETVRNESLRKKTDNVINPYGNGNATQKVISVLKNLHLQELVIKKFFDL